MNLELRDLNLKRIGWLAQGDLREIAQVRFAIVLVLCVSLSGKVLWVQLSIGKERRREDMEVSLSM